jgi:thiamine pyrophosphate-dependent acetolactate synthase large subunit-like protein
MDHVGVMKPITKWVDAVYQTTASPSTSSWAIRHAVSGIPGPAFLEIPMDIFMGQSRVDDADAPAIRTSAPRLSPTAPRCAPPSSCCRKSQAADADGRHQRQVVAAPARR